MVERGQRTGGIKIEGRPDIGGNLPDHVVTPAGGGSIYVGCWQGLRLWLGPDAKLPRLHLAQPTGCPPIAAAQAAGSDHAVAVLCGHGEPDGGPIPP